MLETIRAPMTTSAWMQRASGRGEVAVRIHEYFVTGAGRFPTDMLRYDRAWPAEEAALNRDTHPGADPVRTVRVRGLSAPTDARWISFGWRVER